MLAHKAAVAHGLEQGPAIPQGVPARAVVFKLDQEAKKLGRGRE